MTFGGDGKLLFQEKLKKSDNEDDGPEEDELESTCVLDEAQELRSRAQHQFWEVLHSCPQTFIRILKLYLRRQKQTQEGKDQGSLLTELSLCLEEIMKRPTQERKDQVAILSEALNLVIESLIRPMSYLHSKIQARDLLNSPIVDSESKKVVVVPNSLIDLVLSGQAAIHVDTIIWHSTGLTLIEFCFHIITQMSRYRETPETHEPTLACATWLVSKLLFHLSTTHTPDVENKNQTVEDHVARLITCLDSHEPRVVMFSSQCILDFFRASHAEDYYSILNDFITSAQSSESNPQVDPAGVESTPAQENINTLTLDNPIFQCRAFLTTYRL